MIRRQLPAYSPLTLGDVAAAISAAVARRDSRERLSTLLADRYGADLVLLTDSGTHALQLGLSVVAAASSDGPPTVGLPAYSCYDVLTAALGVDADISFYDVDPSSLGPDGSDLERCLNEGVDALVVGPLFGFPIDWGAVERLASDSGAILVADAAQALGTAWDGKPFAALGDMSILSFARGKGWTGGGGGALLLRGRLAESARDAPAPAATGALGGLKTAVQLGALAGLSRPGAYGGVALLAGSRLGETHYHPPSAVEEMIPISAAAVLRTDRAAHDAIRTRRARAARWSDKLTDVAGASPCVPIAGGEVGFLRYPIRVRPDAFGGILSLGGGAGLARAYPKALPTVLADVTGGPPPPREAHPGAYELAEMLVTLPTHEHVADRDVDFVADLLSK